MSSIRAPPRGRRRGRDKLVGRLGPDALDPIAEFLDLALAFERTHVPSLEGFLHWLEAGAVVVKRDPEQETRDTVRVMTVHGAKGLQSPIVFLPDTMQAPCATPPAAVDGRRPFAVAAGKGLPRGRGRRHARPESEQMRDREYRRLLYVAMTRAEDRLYVCGWQDQASAARGLLVQPDQGWPRRPSSKRMNWPPPISGPKSGMPGCSG